MHSGVPSTRVPCVERQSAEACATAGPSEAAELLAALWLTRRRRQHTDAATITLAQSHPSNALQSQMDKPNTVTTQYMLLFSQRKVALPSVVLSQ